jgi:hypothetical protein
VKKILVVFTFIFALAGGGRQRVREGHGIPRAALLRQPQEAAAGAVRTATTILCVILWCISLECTLLVLEYNSLRRPAILYLSIMKIESVSVYSEYVGYSI